MSESKEISDNFICPKSIILDNFTYSFKDRLSNNYFYFRCKYKKKGNITKKISKEELEKLNKDINTFIKYYYNCKNNQHQCDSKETKKMK